MVIVSRKYFGTESLVEVYGMCIVAAMKNQTVQYKDIAQVMGLPISGSNMGMQVGRLLGEISEYEHNLGRPMLSAVAVSQKGTPGPGFIKLARDLGKLTATGSAAETAFISSEQNAVYLHWQ